MPDTPAQERTEYWHVYGGPHPGATSGKNNYNVITYGPSTVPPSDKLTETPFPYAGQDYPYITTFDHDPTTEEKNALKPEAFK